MTSSSPDTVNPRFSEDRGQLDTLVVPDRDEVDPGLARLWAAIVALDVPASEGRHRLSSAQRCALHQL